MRHIPKVDSTSRRELAYVSPGAKKGDRRSRVGQGGKFLIYQICCLIFQIPFRFNSAFLFGIRSPSLEGHGGSKFDK